MEARSTDGTCKRTDPRRYTARASLGRRCERVAAGYYRRRGYRILARNVRVKGGEIDFLAEHRRTRRLVLVEVRGRTDPRHRPTQWLDDGKRRRLLRLAERVAAEQRRAVHVELVEVLGAVPWWAPWVPWSGPRVRHYGVESAW